MKPEKKKVTGYDKYIDWKIFSIPVALLLILLFIPTPNGMKDVGMEYQIGTQKVNNFISQQLFQKDSSDSDQWQVLTTQIMEQNMQIGALSKDRFLKRDAKWCKKYNIPTDKANFERATTYIKEQVPEETYLTTMKAAMELRKDGLKYENLNDSDKKAADKGAWHIKVSVAMGAFVVLCFLTECIPLPAVSFCIGLIVVSTGVISYSDVAMLYWSDACWFIMGSLMFAAAFVKTGVDKRVCLMMFKRLAVPNTKWITLIFFLIIAPLAAFISDHALAAMFLPIGMLLYQNSLTDEVPEDMELAKLLMISIAMACNIGGPGAPSGGARNVIMMTYLSDMFGVDIGYFQWVTYCFPFLIAMIPVSWFIVNMRFRPKIVDLTPAMNHLQREIGKMGSWNSKQIWALIIFIVMVFGWFTEKAFFQLGIYPVRMGIGTIAVAGAMAYIIAGVVNWRDYQEKVDWGVVWLYAGAMIFGRVLDKTGAAYWLARTVIEVLAPFGMDSGIPLMAVSNGLTAILTNLMADGPAAASVGPITLNMAGMVHPGSTYLPFMAMATAISSSFAYCLIIGTPPNAIVYASGYLEPKDYLRAGLPLFFAANVVLLLLTGVYWTFRGFGTMPGF
ncbi:sodium:sulfate symporter [Desulfobacter hydrogenophilus]|uniref:DASS family sodium-coupled anion symporter n=1 Tax=Desulfobacter hydrogenophilus TaxID=2291 RepID=A0A328FHD5_9BACT|nr:DASS family sodium-coupled anion symporter [Desulfobacter hydrogenophilus]NDY72774.1 DASS family sodium-coupled anion symporter [Desulfobacter hydrogenophilus]QBH13004.1 DASS family sodium-coupled anion symporter [Desulfobacter hydrogenophilus]RAM03988.1 sodium:sulfate symporter [Desulfobacter hydrogenophilus]